MLELILAALILHGGVATYYSEERHGGNPLYCDQFVEETLVYSEDTEDWAAFDVTWYEQGILDCGDKVRLFFLDGTVLDVLALDAGRFGKFYVEDWGPERKIVVDLPEHLRPDGAMSWPVLVINLTRLGVEMPTGVNRCNESLIMRLSGQRYGPWQYCCTMRGGK